MPSSELFVSGAIINDRYRVIARLGHGAMGDVYRAHDEELGEEVALKFLPEKMRSDVTVDLLRNEVRLARAIAHRNVCRVFDIGVAGNRYFLSMQFIDGADLGSLLRRAGRLPAERVAAIALQLCAGLDAAHQLGVLHRDLKPANILVDADGGVHIADFGIACESDDGAWRELMCGTPAYMSPERRAGGRASVESDLFALGLTVRELLTGAIGNPLPSESDAVTQHLVKFIEECTRPDPQHRPHSAADAAVTLRNALTDSESALVTARSAAARQQWRSALDAFLTVPLDALGPADLELLADAALWLGDLERCIAVRERAYAAWMQENDRERAARVALRLVADYGNRLAPAVSSGWLAKADRLLRDVPEGTAHGWLVRARAASAFEKRDYETARAEGARCEAIGLRLGDRDLQALGLHEQGRALVKSGDPEKGWTFLDESAAAAVSGELTPYATGVIFCNVLASCRAVADYDRATAWSDAARHWCDRQSITGFPGVCRVYRAEVMRLRGRWDEARDEVLRAAAELERYSPAITRSAFYELGEIRRRTGDLAGAEQAYTTAHELGLDPEPGLSLLRLRQGKVAAAYAGIRRALAETGDDPLDRGRLLSAIVEAAIEAGERDAARDAAADLDRIASSYASTALLATAAYARGLVARADGRTSDARRDFRSAASLWVEIDAPYERALAQLRIAESYVDLGERDAAMQSARSALATFERLGAALDAVDARALMDRSAA